MQAPTSETSSPVAQCPECNTESRKREHADCALFVALHNEQFGTRLQIRKHRDKPDFLVEDIAKKDFLGIECTNFFYDGEEAKELLGRTPAKGLSEGSQVFLNRQPQLHECAIGRFNELFEKKCEEATAYDFDHKMFLILRVASLFLDTSTFDIYKKEIHVPSSASAFEQVWVVLSDASSFSQWTELRRMK